MTRIIRRERNMEHYYYLVYSFRDKGITKHREVYLGPRRPPPDELDIIKERFITSIVTEMWLPSIKKIQENYARRLNDAPAIATAKEMREFGIRFTHNTNKIEGSTLNFHNVVDILEHDSTPPV